ncbi:MAG: hypothetical protein ACR2J8_07065, partial [Thermomicrobiales bacterium]
MPADVHRIARLFATGISRRSLARLALAVIAGAGVDLAKADTDAAPRETARCAALGRKCGKGGGARCCAGTRCKRKRCVCPAGLKACGGVCVDLSHSDANCGACGKTCGGGRTCQQGACAGSGGGGGGGGDGGGVGNANSPIGTNLAGVTDYATERPFADVFKTARPWFSGVDGGAWEDNRALDLDSNGNVRSLLANQVARSVLFTAVPPDPGLSEAVF